MFLGDKFDKKTGQRLEQLSADDVRTMIREFLAGTCTRFSDSALEEFLNVECERAEAEEIRRQLIALEKRFFDAGSALGLGDNEAKPVLCKLAQK